MRLSLTIRSILALLAVTTGLLIFAIVVGGYFIIHEDERIGASYVQILKFQNDSNVRGNATIYLLVTQGQRTLDNQVLNLNLTRHNAFLLNDTNTLIHKLYNQTR